jgi:hypothetical protein
MVVFRYDLHHRSVLVTAKIHVEHGGGGGVIKICPASKNVKLPTYKEQCITSTPEKFFRTKLEPEYRFIYLAFTRFHKTSKRKLRNRCWLRN